MDIRAPIDSLIETLGTVPVVIARSNEDRDRVESFKGCLEERLCVWGEV